MWPTLVWSYYHRSRLKLLTSLWILTQLPAHISSCSRRLVTFTSGSCVCVFFHQPWNCQVIGSSYCQLSTWLWHCSSDTNHTGANHSDIEHVSTLLWYTNHYCTHASFFGWITGTNHSEMHHIQFGTYIIWYSLAQITQAQITLALYNVYSSTNHPDTNHVGVYEVIRTPLLH